jgi:hypothetical protein
MTPMAIAENRILNCKQFMHQHDGSAQALNQITLSSYSLLLEAWVLALAAGLLGIELGRANFARLKAIMTSCLLTSSPSPSQRCSMHCKMALGGLWLQLGRCGASS